MTQASQTGFSAAFSFVNPAFGAFAALANFIGGKPSQSRNDRAIGIALAGELKRIGVPLWPVPFGGKGGGAPWKQYELGLEALQSSESPAYLAALAEGQRLGFSPDRPVLNRETFRDPSFEIINELYTLAAGAASLRGLAFPTPDELFPRIGSSRTSRDWLALGAGLAPLALDKLAPIAAGELDTATAIASRTPEILVVAPALPALGQVVREVARRGIPAAAKAAARARAARRRRAVKPIRPPLMPPEFEPATPARPEAAPRIEEVVVTGARIRPNPLSLIPPGLAALADFRLQPSPRLSRALRPAPGQGQRTRRNPFEGMEQALNPSPSGQTQNCRVVCDRTDKAKKKRKKSTRRCFPNPASLAAHTKRAVERALSRISP